MRKGYKTDLNKLTHDQIREQAGLEISEAEAEEIRRSLVQYCRLLIEIDRETKDRSANAGGFAVITTMRGR